VVRDPDATVLVVASGLAENLRGFWLDCLRGPGGQADLGLVRGSWLGPAPPPGRGGNVIIQVVRTPADFEETLGASLCRVNCWLPAPEDVAGVEPVVNELFGPRGELGEPDGPLPARVDEVAHSLARLQEFGLQVVVVLTRAPHVVSARGAPNRLVATVDMADYLVAPDPCFFRLPSAAFSAPIHRLGAACQNGHRLVVGDPEREEKTFRVWTTELEVLRDFELAVPWCPTCRAEGDDEDRKCRTA
jgi:hypothetical protein